MPQQPPPRAAQDQHHCHCSCPSPLFNRMREHDTDTSTRPLNSMMYSLLYSSTPNTWINRKNQLHTGVWVV